MSGCAARLRFPEGEGHFHRRRKTRPGAAFAAANPGLPNPLQTGAPTMWQTDDFGMTSSTSPWPDRATDRGLPPAQLTELADAAGFALLAERQAMRCRRHGDLLSALTLQVQFVADPDEALRQQLLAECARRLRSRVRATDVVARWQATHFGLLLPRCAPLHADAVLTRLTRAGGGDYRLGSLLLTLQLSGQVLTHLSRSTDARSRAA